MKPAAPTLLLLALALPATAPGQAPPKPDPAAARVVRVVDGDTIVVLLDGKQTTVRLLGVDTPETVAPGRPVEGFGKQATAFLRSQVEGRSVHLRYEPAARRLDRYGRTLAYVYTIPEGKLVNLAIVAGGYGHAYTAQPYSRIEEFRKAEREAREAGRGLWAATGSPPAEKPAAPKAEAGPATVYVTDTGNKYHREGCAYLAKSSHPRALAELPARYTACSKCEPPGR